MSKEISMISGKYNPIYEWGETHLSAGECGLVFTENDVNETAFFEAYPLNTFLRGEGKTVKEAEENAWKIYQKYKSCEQHEYERLNDRGDGKCKLCGIKHLKILENLKSCFCCGKKDVTFRSYTEKSDVDYFCLEHFLIRTESLLNKQSKLYDQDTMSQYDIEFMNFTLKQDLLTTKAAIESGYLSSENEGSQSIKEYKKLFSFFSRYKVNAFFNAYIRNNDGMSMIDNIKIVRYILSNYPEVMNELLSEYIEHLSSEDYKLGNRPVVSDNLLNKIYALTKEEVNKYKEERNK